MPHPVFDVGAVPHLGQRLDAGPELGLVLLHHRGGDHLKAAVQQLLLGAVAQNLESRPVDADNPGAVRGMAHHAAVHGGEEVLQLPVLVHDLLLVGPLLGDVDGHPHGAHHAAVAVIQGGFVGIQYPLAHAGLNGLQGDAGFLRLHDDPLRLDAGGVVLLHVPDVGVAPPLYLLLGLVHRGAEGVVHLLVDAVLVLVPHQAGGAVDGGL